MFRSHLEAAVVRERRLCKDNRREEGFEMHYWTFTVSVAIELLGIYTTV